MFDRRERKVKNNNNVSLLDLEEMSYMDELTSTKWDISQKLNSQRYSTQFCKTFENGQNFSKKNFETDGFTVPILFLNQDGLGLTLPFLNFGVNDVEDNVGKDRMLDVVDVSTQDAIGMTMREWCRYFNRPKRERLLNVISLEYSQTRMDEIVKAPNAVLEMDWLESCWPKSARDFSVDNQSYLKSLTYPKVRKYCLMSVGGCYTDFHIDLGGTSVWYHIFRGEKIFWMIPPTEVNLKIFEKWSQSVHQSSRFLADLVKNCEKVHLKQGHTFMIPSGWIHGVYTPVDSLVFGGNFLHSFGIDKQLQIYDVEERMKVSTKYRYPFFVDMHWYVLATFVGRLNGKCYLKKYKKKVSKLDNKSQELPVCTTLNEFEMIGIYIIYQWLADLTKSEDSFVPHKIIDHHELLLDAECLITTMPLVPTTSAAHQILEQYATKLINFRNERTKSPTPKKTKKVSKTKVAKRPKIATPSPVSPPRNRKSSPVPKPSKAKRGKLVRPLIPEMPHDMFDKITSPREGSRQIKRPDRFIESTLQ